MPNSAVRITAYKNRLPHRCTVVTPGAVVGVDADNQPIVGPPTEQTNVPCRYEDAERREIVDARQAGVTRERPTLRTAIDAPPVTQQARVTSVVDLAGDAVAAGPYEVISVLTRRYHREIVLERVS